MENVLAATKNNFGFWFSEHIMVNPQQFVSPFLWQNFWDIPSNKNRETLKNSGLKELMSTAH